MFPPLMLLTHRTRKCLAMYSPGMTILVMPMPRLHSKLLTNVHLPSRVFDTKIWQREIRGIDLLELDWGHCLQAIVAPLICSRGLLYLG